MKIKEPRIASGMLGEKVGQHRSITTIYILLKFQAEMFCLTRKWVSTLV